MAGANHWEDLAHKKEHKEDTMRKIALALAAATALVAGVILIGGNTQRAEATPLGASTGILLAIEGVDVIENAARCFYVDGWHGPGFYRCGYRHREGEGWYGPREERREEHPQTTFGKSGQHTASPEEIGGLAQGLAGPASVLQGGRADGERVMKTHADYRKLAEDCVRLAQTASTPWQRSTLLNIAHTWAATS